MTQTLTAPPLPSAATRLASPATGRNVLLPNVTWDMYTDLLEAVGDGSTRLTYDNGWLEIEMPGWLHEMIAALTGEIVTSTLKRQRVTYIPGKSTTWRRLGASRGLEADECYYVQSVPQIRGKLELDLTVDPPPNLAIEVEVESPLLDKVAIYGALGVPELWRVRVDGTCDMLLLDMGGQYQPIAASVAVPPLTSAIVSRYVRLLTETDFPAAVSQFEAEFLPTIRG
jgi:Uma2 family endonuclease